MLETDTYAAVYWQNDSGHKLRGRRAQVSCRQADIFRPAKTVHGRAAEDLFGAFRVALQGPLHHVRLNPARRNGIHPHAVRRDLRSQRTNQSQMSRLCRRIGAHEWNAKQRGHRRGKQDVPVFAFHHARQHHATQAESRRNVGLKHRHELRRRRLHGWLFQVDAGVVHQDGNRTDALFEASNKIIPFRELGDVAGFV